MPLGRRLPQTHSHTSRVSSPAPLQPAYPGLQLWKGRAIFPLSGDPGASSTAARARCGAHALESQSWQGAGPALLLSHPQGQLSHISLPGPGPLCCLGEVQGSFSPVLQWVRGRTSSSSLLSLGPAPLPILWLPRVEGRGYGSQVHATSWWTRITASSPGIIPLGPTHLCTSL